MKNPFSSATKRFVTKEAENQLYAKASEDMENNIIHKGIWTRAFAKAEGNEAKQKALYIELMVQHYKDEIRAGEELEMILKTEEERTHAKAAARAAEKAERDAEAERIQKEQEEILRKEEYWNSPEGQEEIKKREKVALRVLYFFLGFTILIIVLNVGI